MRLTRKSARLHPRACNNTEMSASVVHRNWISVHAFIQPALWTTSWRIRCSQGLRRNLKHLPVSGTMPGMTCWRFARKALQTRWASWLSFFCNCTSSKLFGKAYGVSLCYWLFVFSPVWKHIRYFLANCNILYGHVSMSSQDEVSTC